MSIAQLSSFLLFVLLSFTQCKGQTKSSYQLSYDLDHPEVIKLSDEVHDISGIAYNAAGHSVLAIDDDHGNVYEVPLHQNPKIKQWPFGVPEDFEDIVLDGGMIYVLSSKGRLAYFPFSFPIKNPEYSGLAAKGNNDFETLFKDPAANRLLLICKTCQSDGKHETSVFAFDLSKKEFHPEPVATIQLKDVNAHLNGKSIKNLKPAAAAAHPQTGEIYMLASVNKLLLILDRQLQVKAVYKLHPKFFKQPEGITFSPDGDLLISNEAGKKGQANILIFKKK